MKIRFLFLLVAVCLQASAEIWQVTAPPTAYQRHEVEEDWRGLASVALSVQLNGPVPPFPLLLSFFIQNKQGDWIECATDLRLDGTLQRFDLSLDDQSGDWRNANADRPFGIDQLRQVRSWGLRLYTPQYWSGTLDVTPLERRRQAVATSPRLRPEPLPESVRPGEPVTLNLESLGDTGDVFDPERTPRIEVVGNGTTQHVSTTWVQAYRSRRFPGQEDPRWISWRRPVYRGIWIPEDPGDYHLQAHWQGEARDLGNCRVSGERVASSPGTQSPDPEWTLTVPSQPVWTSTAAGWDLTPSPSTLWYPALDWTDAWGIYNGLGDFAQRLGARFEAALVQSKGVGPLVVVSEEILNNRSRFNWQDHPWHLEGLAGPETLWEDPRWPDLIVRRAQYLWHRVGHYPQVTGLYLDITRASPQHVTWIQNLTDRLHEVLPGVPVYCASPGLPERVVWQDLEPLAGWQSPPGSDTRLQTESNSLDVVATASLPGQFDLSLPGMRHWATVPLLRIDLTPDVPGDLPAKLQVQLRTDPARLFEADLIPLHNREPNRIYLSLQDPNTWSCPDLPDRAWNSLDPLNIREVLVKVFQDGESEEATLSLVNMALVGLPAPLSAASAPLAITPRQSPPAEVDQYERLDWVFDLSREFRNPYNPEEIAVDLTITLEDGTVLRQPGFWEQDTVRQVVDGGEQWSLGSHANWHVIYRPSRPGIHSWVLTVRHQPVNGGPVERVERKGSVSVRPNPKARGYVRKSSQDPRYMEFSNGEFFFPLGHTMRSPTDRRPGIYEPEVQATLDAVDASGTLAFERWFSRMQEEGGNFARVWISNWWLGLEWNSLHPGYHGRKYFNQVNAARLDRLIELAETHGVYLNLETTNHGTFSSGIDGEWEENPWSFYSPDQGPCKHASDFFTNEDGLTWHRNRMRYTLARWGHSTAIAWWGVITESEWVEPYFRSMRDGPRNPKPWHPDPYRSDEYVDIYRTWIGDTADFLRDGDAHPQYASTHFSNPGNGTEMWQRPQMDVVYNNAYRGFFRDRPALALPSRIPPSTNHVYQTFDEGRVRGRHERTNDPWMGVVAEIYGYGKFFEPYAAGKWVTVGEWGGSPSRNRDSNLIAEFHVGLWAATMTRMTGSTGFWWWNLVEYHDLYTNYRGLSRFMKGEDRRGKNLISNRIPVMFTPSNLKTKHPDRLAIGLYNASEFTGYVYNEWMSQPDRSRPSTGFKDPEFPESGPGWMALPDELENGHYSVEFWNTFEGTVFSSREITLSDQERELALPSHRVDLAIKIRKRSP